MDEKQKTAIAGFLDNLSDEQKNQVKACKSPDEISACLSKMGVALPDEMLDTVSGGARPRYNSEKQCWEVLLENGGGVIESYIGSEQDAILIAGFWSYLEQNGEI